MVAAVAIGATCIAGGMAVSAAGVQSSAHSRREADHLDRGHSVVVSPELAAGLASEMLFH